MNYTEEQFNKLPRWAQNEINRLEHNIIHLVKKNDEIYGEVSTNVFVQDLMEEPTLPKNSIVNFYADENNQNRVTVSIKNGKLQINGDSAIRKDMVLRMR